MQILIKKDSYTHPELAGKWLDVDTNHLFSDQYNTNGLRILDKDVSAVKDDARINKGKCRFCGKMLNKGEEEAHFEEVENKTCPGCWWFRESITGSNKSESVNYGVKTVTTEDTYEKICTYKDGCVNMECRKLGIEWFTEKNTFFLKYPEGLKNQPSKEIISYKDKIKCGSYYFENHPNELEPGEGFYRVYNSKKTINFKYDGEFFYTTSFVIGWERKRHLPIPYEAELKVIKEIKKLTAA